jgi:peptidoglycan/LPS O-acetylase OafA/YrhL
MTEPVSSLKYLPELDGLRAVAVLSVIMFHIGMPGFALGWLGVFLFFVISGYLITGILLDSKEHSKRYFRNFYIRRALRILPIYYLFLFATLVAGIFRSWKMSDFAYYLFYIQNYLLGIKSFHPAFPAILNHTWSLAIEEQFYFIWPLIVYLFSKRSLLIISLAFMILAVLSRYIIADFTQNAYLVFTTLPSIIDSLAAGSLLAILSRSRLSQEVLKRYGPMAVLISLPVIILIISISGYGSYWSPENYLIGHHLNLFLYSFCSILFSGLIASAIGDNSILSSVLSFKMLRHLGKISYGLYIYHVPVITYNTIIMNKMKIDNIVIISICNVLATYLIALLSWHLIEKRCILLKDRYAPVD